MKINILGYVLIAFIIIICVKIYRESDTFNLKCIISDVDGNKYCVRERNKLTLAADLLANTTQTLKDLVVSLYEKYPDRANVKRLKEGFNPKKIYETLPTSEYTAYSENTGEKLAFCLNTDKVNNQLIDQNTLIFVAIHELAHIATKSVGHTQEFWNNFKFLLDEAVDINLYKPVDYKKKHQPYCGMDITDNPYFDL
jgi:hypothetical protein